jgi:hypothetical protein
MPRNKPRHEMFSVTPDGIKYRQQIHGSLNSMIRWFKEHFRDPIPGGQRRISLCNFVFVKLLWCWRLALLAFVIIIVVVVIVIVFLILIIVVIIIIFFLSLIVVIILIILVIIFLILIVVIIVVVIIIIIK